MRKSLIAACALGALSLGVGVGVTIGPSSPALAESQSKQQTYRLLDLFGSVFERVREDYVEDVSDKDLIEAAINGMLTSLDPHSSYLDADEFKAMQVQTRGEFGGLGIEVTMENGLVKVVTPIDDTPAFRAGLKSGDLIVSIDDEPVRGLTLDEAVTKMRGKVGSAIRLSIARKGENPFDVTITRDVIEIRSARHRAEGDVGYVRLTQFTGKTYSGLKDAIEALRKEIGEDDLKGYVLDLRNNPGGLLDQAVAVSDAFLDAGEIVSTRSRNDEDTQRFNARDGDLTNGLPVVVLINGGSASASEIVAGALQDHRRAVIVGEKSFGKGSVQTIIPLSANGAIRLTTARYYTPSGRSIQAVGIEPDIEVKQLSVTEVKHRNRRFEANLRNALKNPNDGAGADESTSKGTANGDDDDAADDDGGEVKKEGGAVKDYQLARALDILRGIAIYREQAASVHKAPR